MTGPRRGGNVYSVLKDVLERPAEVDAVTYRPSTATKRFIEAAVYPDRLEPPAGPEPPSITVRWQQSPSKSEFRIDYADPNVSFHCGWHRDDDHPEYGDVHFQYVHPGLDAPRYERAAFEHEAPARLLWEALDRLFGDVIPSLVSPLYDSSPDPD